MQAVKAFVKSHPHMWWGLFLPAYLAAFFTIEHFVTGDYWATELPIDRLIPFCPGCIFFYMSWSPLLVLLGIYLIVRDAEGFRRYIWMLAISFFSATLFCVLVPNGQDLRPAVMPRQDIFTWAVQLTYDLDTNTCIVTGSRKPAEAKKKGPAKVAATAFAKLLEAGNRLIAIIHKNQGLANKDMAKFTSQIQSLCDKWDRDDV